MVSALFIFSYLLHNTLFFQTPYYRALSGIVGTKFAVLLLYYGSKWVKFSCPKCPQTRINADFYLSNDFIVGKSNTSLIASAPVSSIHILSIPNPIPPVGGIPISSAFRKSSSVVFASSFP